VAIERIARDDVAYPAALNDLPNPPAQLWWMGDLSLLARPLVTIVGTRRATGYGERITRELAGSLVRAGACVVSGMALGIDAAAHHAALEASGATIAILGTGADVAYPRAVSLHREIIGRGLVMSELAPGAHSHKGSFPNRNRILAALSALTIIVEARSGAARSSPLTRDRARTRRRHRARAHRLAAESGSNLLLRDGAHPIMSIADALSLAKLAPQPARIRAWTTKWRCACGTRSAMAPQPSTSCARGPG
jgi:DNA processing protein